MSATPATTATPPTVAPADDDFVRLASCPECSGRRRMLVEHRGELRGRCLGCGAFLPVPLATERQSRLVVVGRAGQGIVEFDD